MFTSCEGLNFSSPPSFFLPLCFTLQVSYNICNPESGIHLPLSYFSTVVTTCKSDLDFGVLIVFHTEVQASESYHHTHRAWSFQSQSNFNHPSLGYALWPARPRSRSVLIVQNLKMLGICLLKSLRGNTDIEQSTKNVCGILHSMIRSITYSCREIPPR